ncbi:MAG: pyruvate dehydrogenase (acetyl-transferring) E1 component subunit alpha [Solirubrobacterales bacterium]
MPDLGVPDGAQDEASGGDTNADSIGPAPVTGSVADAGDRPPPSPAAARFQPDHMLPAAERGKALLYRMLLIRRFEERAGEMYARAKIGGFLHLCIGEEATVVGTAAAMRPEDYMISTYREHGQVLARGTSPNNVMAELFGRVDGVSKGRGGSMHMFDLEKRFMGGYGIVGGHLPIAAGLGLAVSYKGTGEAIVCMLGDGASNQGTFGETLNLAALWRLPVVFIIVNNQFGMGTSVARHSAVTDLSTKGEGFGVPGTRCDGMDVLDVESCVQTALDHARTERHPVLIEAVTYRFRGHSMADPEEYRQKEEVEQWRRRDPIMQFANRLIGGGAISGADAEQLDRQALAEVDAAVEFADKSPFPDLDSLYDDVYVLGDQLRGWYSVDTRSPGATRGEQIAGDEDIQRLAEAGAAHRPGEEFGEQVVMREGVRRDGPGALPLPMDPEPGTPPVAPDPADPGLPAPPLDPSEPRLLPPEENS